AQTTTIASSDLGKTGLLLFIAKHILGSAGPIVIGVAMGLACLSTSIGLITAGADFFEKVSKGKLTYKFNAIVISLVSFLVALLGVDKIIAFSSPILNLLYPVSITIIVTTLLSKWLTNVKAIRLGVYTSLVFSLLLLIPGLNLSFLPLSKVGFGWVVPTILGIIIGYIIFKDKSVKNSDGKLAY
ncbi:branched-chain amino acid transport system II carrier protein, partial [uncultured Clostridium sp.]|uniref:branched-chain amino acid transport system II carrier protein n=1 Tax=uncultured Clostridium sp. TaxID=59620 RepID=UPI002599462C